MLHGVHSPGLSWEPFVCIFTWCTLAWAPLGTICMHFYVVYIRLGSPGSHLYAFLRGVHSSGVPWGILVCIFTWCTCAWTSLGGICMHFDVVYIRLDSPGCHLYACLHGVHLPGLAWGPCVCSQPSQPANPASQPTQPPSQPSYQPSKQPPSHPATQPSNQRTSQQQAS